MARKHSPTDDLQELRTVFAAGSGLSAQERAVLAVLILRRNGETGRCDPSLSRIAEETGFGRSTVVRALELLDRAKLVERRRHKDGRTRTSYVVKVPASPGVALVPERDQPQGGWGVVRGLGQTSASEGHERTQRTNGGTNEAAPGGEAPASAPHSEAREEGGVEVVGTGSGDRREPSWTTRAGE